MNKNRSEFEKTKTYDLCKSWQVDFDEECQYYYSINPVFHADVTAINSAWRMFQEQQTNVDELQNNINLLNEALDIKEQLNQKLREREDELQKRVDQQGLIIAKVMSIASDLQKSWAMFEIGKKLEQALNIKEEGEG